MGLQLFPQWQAWVERTLLSYYYYSSTHTHHSFIHPSSCSFIHLLTHSWMQCPQCWEGRGKGRKDKLYSVQGFAMNTTSGFPITKSFLPFLCSRRRTRETEEGGDAVGNLRRKWGRKEIECFGGGGSKPMRMYSVMCCQSMNLNWSRGILLSWQATTKMNVKRLLF